MKQYQAQLQRPSIQQLFNGYFYDYTLQPPNSSHTATTTPQQTTKDTYQTHL